MALGLSGSGEITGFDPVASGFGKVLQVVSATKTDTFSTSAASASITDVTGLSVSITPSNATSKILVMWSVSGDAANVGWGTVIKRGGSGIGLGDAATSRTQVTDLGIMSGATADQNAVGTGHYLDSPSTTSAVTYQVALFSQRSSAQVLSVNMTGNDSANAYIARASSSITVMEIAA